MSTDHDDALSRVRLMASGDPSWDLSPADCEALTRVLAMIDTLQGTIRNWERIIEKLGRCDERD